MCDCPESSPNACLFVISLSGARAVFPTKTASYPHPLE